MQPCCVWPDVYNCPLLYKHTIQVSRLYKYPQNRAVISGICACIVTHTLHIHTLGYIKIGYDLLQDMNRDREINRERGNQSCMYVYLLEFTNYRCLLGSICIAGARKRMRVPIKSRLICHTHSPHFSLHFMCPNIAVSRFRGADFTSFHLIHVCIWNTMEYSRVL